MPHGTRNGAGMKVINRISSLIDAVKNCEATGNAKWALSHRAAIATIESGLPSGSGFDAGTTIDVDASTPERIVIKTAFHHMNTFGEYDGWSHHTVTVLPSLQFGFKLRISGSNRSAIKEYINDCLDAALSSEIV